MKRVNGGLFQIKFNTIFKIGEEIEITNEEDIKSLKNLYNSSLLKPILIEYFYEESSVWVSTLASVHRGRFVVIYTSEDSYTLRIVIDENEITYSIYEL